MMTEEEHIKASTAVTEFCVEIGKSAARTLQPFNEEIRLEVMYMLQQATASLVLSLF